jgi:replicative DNA helicase
MATYPHIIADQERPTSVHAEMTILGAMLVEPVAIIDATMLLKTDDFALDSHRKIYAAMLQLVELGHGVDIVTVTDYLSKKKELDSVGGLPYLASLSEGLPRKLSIESYVRIVRDKSLMRQLLTVCDMGMIEASDQSREALDVLNQVTSRLTEISEHAVTGGFSDIAAIVKESFGSIDALYEQGREVTGLATHYIEFDRGSSRGQGGCGLLARNEQSEPPAQNACLTGACKFEGNPDRNAHARRSSEADQRARAPDGVEDFYRRHARNHPRRDARQGPAPKAATRPA